MPFAPVAKPELFARLAEGHAARLAVVTPNVRLARELAREFDAGQAAKGLKVWETADILPLPAFVERLYEDALYSGLAATLPLLLTDAQAQSLWEAAIRESRWGEALLAVPQAASEAARAWALAQGWRIDGALASFPGNDDARAFADWAKDYARRSQKAGATDRARLADVVAPLLKEEALRKPALLVLYAFDELKPQDRDFLEACEKAGIELRACAPERRRGKAVKHVYPSAREELDAAAQWARAKLEEGATRIGIVVPQLGERRKEVARVFARTLHPGHNLPGAEPRALPFNISLGAPLEDYPIVRAALSILEFAGGPIPFEQASRLIRSPMIAGASAEMAQRALLDARLRRSAPAKLNLGKLVGLVEGAPVLRQQLERLFALPKPEVASPHDWARHFTAQLAAVGFPGERTLDSAEHQARAKLNECLAELAKLERVAPRMGAQRALAHLARLARDTLFQPESPEAPVQVLGVLESAGLSFDALWLGGMTDEAWPLAARPNPFLPPALQKKAGIPEASAEATLARGRRITEGWLAAAPEVVVSHPAWEEDRKLVASPLVSHLAVSPIPETSAPRWRALIFAARAAESAPDGAAPALATKTPRGGTRILADQAACPFRAFARHRLGAEALEEPAAGPDARARGLLLHALMRELWGELKDSAALEADCGPAIERAARAAVAEARLEEPFAELERMRLAKIARDWLEVERKRAPFEVAAREDKRKLRVAGLELEGRIDRLDRLASGGHALIDYKTGRPTPNAWQGGRPDDPQLPLYALSAPEEISAVAYAKLQTGAMRYMGFARDKEKGFVAEAKDWGPLINGWKQSLDALGAGFTAGDARVDPKNGLATCRYCDLQTLCRVHERLEALAEDEGDAED
jgi:ATP-dependent helicase/nuclease subunit B